MDNDFEIEHKFELKAYHVGSLLYLSNLPFVKGRSFAAQKFTSPKKSPYVIVKQLSNKDNAVYSMRLEGSDFSARGIDVTVFSSWTSISSPILDALGMDHVEAIPPHFGDQPFRLLGVCPDDTCWNLADLMNGDCSHDTSHCVGGPFHVDHLQSWTDINTRYMNPKELVFIKVYSNQEVPPELAVEETT